MNYILCGELYPIIRKHLNKILKDRLGEPDNFNVVKLDFEESPVEEIIYEASSLPLGYEKKAVVVDNASFFALGFLSAAATTASSNRCFSVLLFLNQSVDQIR